MEGVMTKQMLTPIQNKREYVCTGETNCFLDSNFHLFNEIVVGIMKFTTKVVQALKRNTN